MVTYILVVVTEASCIASLHVSLSCGALNYKATALNLRDETFMKGLKTYKWLTLIPLQPNIFYLILSYRISYRLVVEKERD
jgi:hypothetical protein